MEALLSPLPLPTVWALLRPPSKCLWMRPSPPLTPLPPASGRAPATPTHTVPGATIALAPPSGPASFRATATGIVFPRFRNLSSLLVGRVQALPSSAPNTYDEGHFDTTILVPNLNPGPQTVTVTAGEITASGLFTITARVGPATPTPTPTPLPSVPPAVALAPWRR